MPVRDEWVKAKRLMGGYKCIRNRTNQSLPGQKAEYEHCLVCKTGEIWENGENYRAVIWDKHSGKRLEVLRFLNQEHRHTPRGDLVVDFTAAQLKYMLLLLGRINSLGYQIRRANAA